MPDVVKRKNVSRSFHFATNEELASKAIGKIEPGCEIFGISKGQFSKIDIIKHCLNEIGVCDVSIATWTAANSDISVAEMLLKNAKINSCIFMLDRSFPTRQPKYFKKLLSLQGETLKFCLGNSHAKFVTLRNDQFNLAVRTSMNLNKNRRIETFEISDSPELCDYLDKTIKFCMDNQDKKSTQILNEFSLGTKNIKDDNCTVQIKIGAW